MTKTLLDPLERFGKILIEQLKDYSLDWVKDQIEGKGKSLRNRGFHQELSKLSSANQSLVLDVVNAALSAGMHNLLARLNEMHDFNEGIAIEVDGVNVLSINPDGIHYELFGECGWETKFSHYAKLEDLDEKYSTIFNKPASYHDD